MSIAPVHPHRKSKRAGKKHGHHLGDSLTRSFSDRLTSVAFLLPILVVFLVLGIIPLIQSFVYSLTDYNGISTSINFVGLENYQRVFTDSGLRQGLGFTLIFAACTTVFITMCAIPLAVFLNKKFLGQNFARSLFFFLGVPSHAILGLVWQYIFSPLKSGALNSALTKLGFDTVPFLADPTIARICIIFVAVWAGVGWHATLYIAYLQAIPGDIYEQAEVDGANSMQQFFHITLPQLVPGIVVSTFLLMTSGLKVYELPFAMTKGGPGYATNTVTQSIIVQGISQGNYGLGSALAVLFTLASAIVVFLQIGVANQISRRFT